MGAPIVEMCVCASNKLRLLIALNTVSDSFSISVLYRERISWSLTQQPHSPADTFCLQGSANQKKGEGI